MKLLTPLFVCIFLYACNQQVAPQVDANLIYITPTPYTTLTNKIEESSGLTFIDGKIYTINDSGGKAELYQLNDEGDIEHTIKLTNAENIDWESLAANQKNVFIGDLGNNAGNRKDLMIHQISRADLQNKEVVSKPIPVEYGNQTDFRNQRYSHSFDGEALIALANKLIIFSKDWLNNNTEVYHVKLNSEEKQVLFPTEQMKINTLITGATYNEHTKKLVLSGYLNYQNFLWVFEGATEEKFLTDNYKRIALKGLYNAQVEGVTWLTDDTILFSTEETDDFKEQMWTITF